MRETSTWMPLYIGDYLADTTHLTYAEHGAYLLLIMVYWRSGKPLPDDDVLLARYCRANRWQWKTLRPVLEPFFQVRDGAWSHVRVTRELAHAASKSAAARANVLTRYKEKNDDLRTKVPSTTDGLPSGYSSPSQEDKKDSVAVATDAEASEPIDPSDAEMVWGWGLKWLAKSSGKPPDSLRALLGRWCKAYSPENVLIALRTAEAQQPPIIDPVSWLVAVLQTRSSANGKARKTDAQPGSGGTEAVMARLRERAERGMGGVSSGNGFALLPPVPGK